MNIKQIETEMDYKAVLARIESLWAVKADTTKGEELSVLAKLVEDYEAVKFKILPPDPIEALKFRLAQSGM